MTKPSQELLRRAREWREQYYDMGSDIANHSADKMLAQFAEQIVREAAEIALSCAGHADPPEQSDIHKGADSWPVRTEGVSAMPEETKPRRCWPWSHRYGKWETFERGVLTRQTTTEKILEHSPNVIGVYQYQRRTCEMCGKLQLREVSA